MNNRRLALLGSTGSIGKNTLEVVRSHPNYLSIGALAAKRNWKLLADQVREFKPKMAAIFDPRFLAPLTEAVKGCDVALFSGMDGLLEASCGNHSNTLLSALVGAIGLEPVLEGAEAKKTICLANKEPLVIGGPLVIETVKRRGVSLIPIDSEHSAIFQCMYERDLMHVQRIILTASGGPFRNKKAQELASVTPKEALQHPNWRMGGKITIDSASLMNKGLEVIEAHWLFGIDFNQIEVVIHPQSIIHSMVEFVDGSVLAQMGSTDMRGPIQYALSHPERWKASSPRIDLLRMGDLTFEAPRVEDFPCLNLAYDAGRRGGNLPCIMNAANEVAVEAYLNEKIGFLDIPRIIRTCMENVPFQENPNLKFILDSDNRTRKIATNLIGQQKKI